MDTSLPVLVVDDSPTMTTIISNLVRKVGFTEVDIAHDGGSALDHLRQKQYGLVLSDWEMQPMSGEELFKEMRQDRKIGNIPIILITATAGSLSAANYSFDDTATASARALSAKPTSSITP